MKALLVYNPWASHKRAEKLRPQVESYLEEQGIEFDLCLTETSGHATEMVREASFDDYDGLIVAGGDGTLFEVVNGYFQNPSSKRIPLGIIPTGTGNAVIRDLDLDTSRWKEAVDVIVKNSPKKVDVGLFHTRDQDYYFLNIMGIGFVADVTKTAYRLKVLGNLSYTLGVLYQTAFLRDYPLKIEIDGKMTKQRNIFVEISNTRYTSNFLMAPHAKIDDGLLDVTLLRKINRRRLLKCFPMIFTGEHVKLPEIEQIQAKKIRIVTEKPKVLTPDGELIGTTPVTVECLQQALDVFWK